MAKKRQRQAPAPTPASTPEPESSISAGSAWLEQPALAATLLLLLAALVYWPSLHNGFVFFDDDQAILYNPALKNPSFGKFFSGHNLGMYAPVSWIAYWIGSLISGTNAWGYHFLGLLLHAVNTVLAYYTLRLLTGRHRPAFITAALFAVHPVQAEAVCWAAALSTVLFSFFYLLSLLSYVHWKQTPARIWYGLSFAAFMLAGLSKSAAVTLPLLLLATDVYKERKWDWGYLLNKAPFFIFSLIFGVYTFVTRAQEGHDIEAASRVFSAVDRFWMVCETLLFYPVKLLVPLGFSVSYPFVKPAGVWPVQYYLAPLALAGLAFAVWKYGRRQSDLLLGIALYALPLTVMLPFRTVGSFELRSDRYVYLSSIGLFWLLALVLDRQKPALRNGLLVAITAFLGYLTLQQTQVWKNGIALFNNCVDKTPQAALCQCNLAYSELLDYKFDRSVYHYSEALKYDPATVEAYNGRGQAYFQLKKIPEALADFNQAIQAGIVTPKLFLNRAKCLVLLNRPQEALPDLNRSLELEPNAPEAYYFRGVAYEKTGAPDQAFQDYNHALQINSNYQDALLKRAVLYMGRQQFKQAIEDYTHVLQISPKLETVYNNRGYAYLKNGEPDKALADLNQAIALNPRYLKAYQTRAVIYQQMGKPAQAQADMKIVQQSQQGH